MNKPSGAQTGIYIFIAGDGIHALQLKSIDCAFKHKNKDFLNHYFTTLNTMKPENN